MKERSKVFSIAIIFIIVYLFLFSSRQGIAQEVKDKKIRSYWELKFLNIDQQTSEFSCGVAVLATLFTYYYDIPIKEKDITDEFFKKMIEEKRGISFLDMKKFAISKGFEAYGYKMNFDGLMKMLTTVDLPVIVHTMSVVKDKKLLHFTLLIGMIEDYLILNDTAFGHIVISIDDFLSKWSGYALIISPPKEESSKGILEKVSDGIKKEKERTTRYVSKIYFYQNHPNRFNKSFTGF